MKNTFLALVLFSAPLFADITLMDGSALAVVYYDNDQVIQKFCVSGAGRNCTDSPQRRKTVSALAWLHSLYAFYNHDAGRLHQGTLDEATTRLEMLKRWEKGPHSDKAMIQNESARLKLAIERMRTAEEEVYQFLAEGNDIPFDSIIHSRYYTATIISFSSLSTDGKDPFFYVEKPLSPKDVGDFEGADNHAGRTRWFRPNVQKVWAYCPAGSQPRLLLNALETGSNIPKFRDKPLRGWREFDSFSAIDFYGYMYTHSPDDWITGVRLRCVFTSLEKRESPIP